MYKYFLAILLSLSSVAYAFELVMINAVSSSKKTFITKHGRREGFTEGMTGTFTAESFSVIAKAILVTGKYTHWQLVNSNLQLPFEKGSIVTYYPNTENVWALTSEEDRAKFMYNQLLTPRYSFGIRGALLRGLSSTYSDIPAPQNNRGGFAADFFYEKFLSAQFSWDANFRLERELTSFSGENTITTRSMVIVNLYLYFDQLKSLIGGKVYTGLGMGYGYSFTTDNLLSQAGTINLLPGFKLGLDLPFTHEWSFLIDAGLENLQIKEKQNSGNIQAINHLNLKGSIGLKANFY